MGWVSLAENPRVQRLHVRPTEVGTTDTWNQRVTVTLRRQELETSLLEGVPP